MCYLSDSAKCWVMQRTCSGFEKQLNLKISTSQMLLIKQRVQEVMRATNTKYCPVLYLWVISEN
jgi:hypothetical protein